MNPIVAIVAVGIGVLAAALAIDRRRHWLVTVAAVVVIVGIVIALVETGDGVGGETIWQRVALGIGFGLIGVLGGSPVVGLVLRFAQGAVPLGQNGGIVVDDADDEDGDDDERGSRKRDRSGAGKAKRGEREILRGGATIGYLERVALIGAVAAGQPSAIAIIIAIKGLGRFSELDGSEARERFIIGTLTSLVWAGACTVAALLVH